jgi:hypothetical protein
MRRISVLRRPSEKADAMKCYCSAIKCLCSTLKKSKFEVVGEDTGGRERESIVQALHCKQFDCTTLPSPLYSTTSTLPSPLYSTTSTQLTRPFPSLPVMPRAWQWLVFGSLLIADQLCNAATSNPTKLVQEQIRARAYAHEDKHQLDKANTQLHK